MYMLRAEVLKALGRGREAVLSYAECCEKFLPVNKQKKCSLLTCAIKLAVQNSESQTFKQDIITLFPYRMPSTSSLTQEM